MKRWIWIIWLTAVTATLSAQETDIAGAGTISLPGWAIRTDLFRWISPNKLAANMGLECAPAAHHRLDIELGWFLDSGYFANHTGESYRGPRLRMGWKYIAPAGKGMNLFAGLQCRYDQITHREWEYVARQGQQYVETFLRHRRVESLGLAVRLGGQFYLEDANRWYIEPEFILGLARHDVTYRDPADVMPSGGNNEFLDFRFSEGRSYWIYPLIGLHIGYVLMP